MRVVRPAIPVLAAAVILPFVAAPAARAQSTSLSDQFDDVRSAVGLGRDRPPIDFTQRAPIVVPPTYTLPPPGGGDPEHLGVNDPDIGARRRALADPRRPVPPSDPGAAAHGAMSRSYLVDPPSGLRDPAAVAADITHDTAGPATISHAKPAHHHRKKAADAATQ